MTAETDRFAGQRMLTAAEAATLLRIHPNRLYILIRAQGIPATYVGRAIRIDRDELDAWIKKGGSRAMPTDMP